VNPIESNERFIGAFGLARFPRIGARCARVRLRGKDAERRVERAFYALDEVLMTEKSALLAALLAAAVGFAALLARALRRERPGWPGKLHLGIGFVTDFLDTLGIGSFATTTSAYRLSRQVDDRLIPGTLNVGHALPTLAQAFIYITLIDVDVVTLASLIAAAALGAWLGAAVVSRWSRRAVRLGMGLALSVAAVLMTASALSLLPVGRSVCPAEGWQQASRTSRWAR
jgi:uncharacterized membrane protein YfcA